MRKNHTGSFELLAPATAAVVAIALPTLFVVILCSLFRPHWETNDDIAMSMIAHGYGAIAFASPKIVFSNVLWGYLVSAMPSVAGAMGYSLVTLLALTAAGAGILYGLLRSGADPYGSAVAVGMMLVNATLAPQFTVTAGLLAVSAVALALAHLKTGETHTLILCCILAFAGFLVRWLEFFFVVAVAVPLIPLQRVRNAPRLILALVIFSLAAIVSTYIDAASYQGPEWHAFNELNGIRISFTDYGVGTLLKARPDILARHGYSASDIDLISGFFLLDPQLADPSSLRSMFAELGQRTNFGSLNNAATALSALFKTELLALSGAVFMLLVLFRNPRHLLSVSLFVAGVVTMGLLGRPGVTRIYYAPLALLTIAAIVNVPRVPSLKWGARVILSLALLGSSYWVISKSRSTERAMKVVERSFPFLVETPIIAWGGGFPYKLVYPVLSAPPAIQIRALGSFSLAPYSTLVTEKSPSANVFAQIKSGVVVYLSASQKAMQEFATYCQDRLHGSPNIVKDRNHPDVLNLYKAQCKPNRPNKLPH